MNLDRTYCTIVNTRIGEIGIVWRRDLLKPKVIHIILPSFSFKKIKKIYPDIEKKTNKEINKIARALYNYSKGIPVRFNPNCIDYAQLTNFQKKVLKLAQRIPRGSVSTYGNLAKNLGIPKAARAVGQALAHNPFPIIIPCHRVIKSDGTLGGFGGNIGLKKKLLMIEKTILER